MLGAESGLPPRFASNRVLSLVSLFAIILIIEIVRSVSFCLAPISETRHWPFKRREPEVE